MFPNTITLLNIPRSHNGSGADGETGEEFEGKTTDLPPPSRNSRNGRRITEGVVEVETDEVAQARR